LTGRFLGLGSSRFLGLDPGRLLGLDPGRFLGLGSSLLLGPGASLSLRLDLSLLLGPGPGLLLGLARAAFSSTLTQESPSAWLGLFLVVSPSLSLSLSHVIASLVRGCRRSSNPMWLQSALSLSQVFSAVHNDIKSKSRRNMTDTENRGYQEKAALRISYERR